MRGEDPGPAPGVPERPVRGGCGRRGVQRAGKTYILIRAGDRNVFIAENKIWKSPKTIRDALTQLLSYLVWRDTKAALLLFIRSGETTAIIEKESRRDQEAPELQAGPRNGSGR